MGVPGGSVITLTYPEAPICLTVNRVGFFCQVACGQAAEKEAPEPGLNVSFSQFHP